MFYCLGTIVHICIWWDFKAEPQAPVFMAGALPLWGITPLLGHAVWDLAVSLLKKTFIPGHTSKGTCQHWLPDWVDFCSLCCLEEKK